MDITIFIRAKNEAKYIAECLDAIFKQETSLSYEVVILDSGSQDETVKIASKYPVTIYSIPNELFHYAKALNFGVAKSTATYFISLSAHAIPVNKSWLQELVSPMLIAHDVCASFSRHVGYDTLSTREARSLNLDFPDRPITFTKTVLDNLQASGVDYYSAGKFSNVSSCIRTNLAKEIPFREIPYSEDRLFALEAINKNHKISYCPKSEVKHSHYPRLKEFQSVAFKATQARWQINSLFASNKRYPNFFDRLIAQIKLPLVAIWVALNVPLLWIFTPSSRLKRELDFKVACIGTTLGKLNGLSLVKPDFLSKDIPLADPTQLLNNCKLLKSSPNV